MTRINMYDKPIPKGAYVKLTVSAGIGADEEFNVEIIPDKGFKLDLSYIIIDMTNAPELEANLIAVTEKGESPLLANNVTQADGEVVIDRTDFGGALFDKVVLYAKTTTATTQDNEIVVYYGGRQVTPWM